MNWVNGFEVMKRVNQARIQEAHSSLKKAMGGFFAIDWEPNMVSASFCVYPISRPDVKISISIGSGGQFDVVVISSLNKVLKTRVKGFESGHNSVSVEENDFSNLSETIKRICREL